MSITACAITTIDNPYDPFTQFDAWYRYDLNRELTHRDELYVNCCAILDRFSHTSDALSEEENAREIERAIDEIIKTDVTNVYKKITKTVEDTPDVEPDDFSMFKFDGKLSQYLRDEAEQLKKNMMS